MSEINYFFSSLQQLTLTSKDEKANILSLFVTDNKVEVYDDVVK